MGVARTTGRGPLRCSSADRRRGRDVAVEVAAAAVVSHCVVFTSLCDWRTSKGSARREKRQGNGGIETDEGTRAGGQQGGEGAGWPFFLQSTDTPFVSLAHSNLHTQYAAAVW